MIIAFSGLAGSGKDTAADRLVAEHGFVKIAFADEMKRICARVYPRMTREHLWGPSEMRNAPIKDYPRNHGPWVKDGDESYRCMCCNIVSLGVPGKPEQDQQCYLTTRFALQQLGTEWGRTCYIGTWTDIALDAAVKVARMSGVLRSVHYSYTPFEGLALSSVPVGPRPNGVVISDLRWPAANEGSAIRAVGGFLAKMKRGEGLAGGSGAHESETAMACVPDAHFDIVIDNREWSHEQLYSYLDQIVWAHAPRKKTT
jgi:hypothetical protein